MKRKLTIWLVTLLLAGTGKAQQLIQGTLKPGPGPNDFEIWLKPNFSSNTTYLYQMVLPIAYPSSALPQPTGITYIQSPGFITAFGNNYVVTVNPAATATGGAE